MGRTHLKIALDSISAQSYKPIEVILINSSEKRLENILPLDVQVTVLDQPTPLSRAEAANAGIDAANGSLLLFLDDDDYLSNDHISNLASKMYSDSSVRAVYSGTQKVTSDGEILDQVYSTDFDPILLMRDNYIPIHSMLFDKSLIDEGCRFDPQFEIYEDWDFWLQLAQKTKFLHIPNVTAYYRSGGDSGTALSDENEKYDPESRIGKARAQIFEKWKTQWAGSNINKLIGQSYNELATHCDELSTQLKMIGEQYDILKIDLNKSNADYKNLKRQKAKLEEEMVFISSSLQESLAKISHLEVEIEHRVTHEVQLQTSLTEILSSRSWKFTSPFRKAGILSKTIFKLLSFHKTKTHTKKAGMEKTNNIFSKNKSHE